MQWLELSAWDAGAWIDKSQAQPRIVVTVDAQSSRGATLLKSLENSGAFAPLLPQPDGVVAVSGVASRANADMIRLLTHQTTIEAEVLDVTYPVDPSLRRATTHANVLLNAVQTGALYLSEGASENQIMEQTGDALESDWSKLGLVLPAQPERQADTLALLRQAGIGDAAEVRKVPTRTLAVRGVALQSLDLDPEAEIDPDSEVTPALFLVVEPGRGETPAKLDGLSATIEAVESAIALNDAERLGTVTEDLTRVTGPLPDLENLLRGMIVSEVEQVLAEDVEQVLAGGIMPAAVEDPDDLDALAAALTDAAPAAPAVAVAKPDIGISDAPVVPGGERDDEPGETETLDRQPMADLAEADGGAPSALDTSTESVRSARRRKPATSNDRKPAPSAAEPRDKGDHLDFGEYIPRARKERFAGIGVAAIQEMNDDGLREFIAGQSSREVTKSAIWPRPSAVVDKAAGLTPLHHLALVECWKVLNGKPRTNEFRRRRSTPEAPTLPQIRAFMTAVGQFRDFCLAATSTEDLLDRFRRAIALEKEKDEESKQKAIQEAAKNDEYRRSQGLERPYHNRYGISYPCSNLAERILFLGTTDNSDPLVSGAPVPEHGADLGTSKIVRLVVQSKSWDFNIYNEIIKPVMHMMEREQDYTWDTIISKPKSRSTGKPEADDDAEQDDVSDGAAEDARDPVSKTTVREQSVATRTGLSDYRNGVDIPETALLDQLGLRGGQYGNWVGQRDRAAFLNLSYDSLRDLAEVGGYPLRAIGFDDRLGAAWGARGRGGHAAAHYEPGLKVINLTKPSGAGSLAHEWAHAVDHWLYDTLLPRESGLKSVQPFLSEVLAEHRLRSDFAPIRREFNMEAAYEKAKARLGDRLNSADPDKNKTAESDLEYWVEEAKSALRNQEYKRLRCFDEILGYKENDSERADATQAVPGGEESERNLYRATLEAMAGFVYALDRTDLSSFDDPATAWFEQHMVLKSDLMDRFFKGTTLGDYLLPVHIMVEPFKELVRDKVCSWYKVSQEIEWMARDSLYDAFRDLFAKTKISPELARDEKLVGYPLFMLHNSELSSQSFRFGDNPRPYKGSINDALYRAVIDNARDLLVKRVLEHYPVEDPQIPTDARFNDLVRITTADHEKHFTSRTKFLVENIKAYGEWKIGYMQPSRFPGGFAPGTLKGISVTSRMTLNCNALKNRRAYYASAAEKFARSFEICVKRALAEQGSENTYLVAVRKKEGGVYPEGAQLDELMVQFRKLNKATAALARHLGTEDRELKLITLDTPQTTGQDGESTAIQPAKSRKRLAAA